MDIDPIVKAKKNVFDRGSKTFQVRNWDAERDYFFFWVRAEAAADLAALDAVLLDRILEAEEATLLLVLSVEPRCVRAEAATALSTFVDDLLFRTFAADEATFLLVLALFAMG
jgi:hypothetical protein